MPSKGMSKADFNDWRKNPVTEEFFQYLDDCIVYIREQWEDGQFIVPENLDRSTVENTTAVANVQTLKQLRNLEWSDICSFYGIEEEEEEEKKDA